MKGDMDIELVRDTLAAFQSVCRLRMLDEAGAWTLHSWHIYTVMRGGGRITPYPEEMVASLWMRALPSPPTEQTKG